MFEKVVLISNSVFSSHFLLLWKLATFSILLLSTRVNLIFFIFTHLPPSELRLSDAICFRYGGCSPGSDHLKFFLKHHCFPNCIINMQVTEYCFWSKIGCSKSSLGLINYFSFNIVYRRHPVTQLHQNFRLRCVANKTKANLFRQTFEKVGKSSLDYVLLNWTTIRVFSQILSENIKVSVKMYEIDW